MLMAGENSPGYIPSATLSSMIADYNKNAEEIVPFMKQVTQVHEICSERPTEIVFNELCRVVEPVVVRVRSGLENEDLRTEIVNNLVSQEGYRKLEVYQLVRDEASRHTAIGQSFGERLKLEQSISPNEISLMLRKIIYSGNKRGEKFVLTEFP